MIDIAQEKIKFENEKKIYSNYINRDNDLSNKYFYKVMDKLVKLDITDISVYLTNSFSIYFRILNYKGYDIHLEVFYNETTRNSIESVCTIYQDNIVFSQFGKILDVIEDMITFCNK